MRGVSKTTDRSLSPSGNDCQTRHHGSLSSEIQPVSGLLTTEKPLPNLMASQRASSSSCNSPLPIFAVLASGVRNLRWFLAKNILGNLWKTPVRFSPPLLQPQEGLQSPLTLSSSGEVFPYFNLPLS
ncbi:hypothetical protein NPIL_250141 [Nephila pilipes]|uniref:Uncharacterized protein n=1 Tax=Nephila pilipes TaxID=299642 RepID=A0A8X6NI24_NEPPI|nr:hypothetical protein NPIL_250141 [Nephila pilipes]